MPIGWIPKRQTLEEEMQQAIAKAAFQKLQTLEEDRWQAPAIEQPVTRRFGVTAPTIERPPIRPTTQVQAPALRAFPGQKLPKAPAIPPSAIKAPAPEKPTPAVAVPFWQRALQVFSAPFQWVDENVIKPGLALTGTAVGLVPEVERMPGEDFWEWKKRSWATLETPGININVPWSDEPWRIDVKGVMEFAPWLLIPGAGQVGSGVRAATGIAGLLGKAGRVGRVLGRAVEYSPWGIVEKTAGVAIKAGVKVAGKVTGGVSTRAGERVFGKIPEPEPPAPVVREFADYLKETVLPARKAFEEALGPELRAKQYASLESIAKQFREGKITATQRQALEETALKEGSLKAKFAVEPPKFTPEKVDELLNPIYKAAENNFEAKDAAQALRNLLLKGDLPEPRHFNQFAIAYGEDFAKTIGEFSRLPRSTMDKALDALNLPRAVLASGDLSATFRQGLFLLLTRPEKAPRAFWRQLKAFASEKISLDMDDVLRNKPLYQTAVEDGVEFTALRKGARLVAKEEPFTSNLAQVLPLVRRSERAFTTFLNEMRMGAYEAAHGAMTAQGATPAQFKLLGSFINIASGRGTLPANLDRYAPLLNTVLFSARYQMSTLQLPRQLGRMLISQNPYMRKEAAKALISFVGGGSALLGLLKATGRAKVEIDPRSADFGKIVIGETRLDIWRGYVQYARFAAQLLTGESKTAYGNMNKADRFERALNFVQSKSSPGFGLMVDLLKGENYRGEPLFDETTGFIKAARERLVPIAVQDVVDAMEQSGMNGLWTAIPSTLGVGVLTYVNDLVRVKEKIARGNGFESWDEIDPKTQREIENTSAELQTAYIKFDRQVMGTAWGDWRLAGNAIEDTFRENVEMAVSQYRATGDGYQFREKIADAFTARRGGYSAREKMPQFEDIVRRLNVEDTLESLVGLGPEQMAIKTYNDALWGDDMYDEFGDYRFDEAEIRKQELRQQLGEDMFDYVEEYRGLKTADLPSEYQELVKAKQVLRPYWQVEAEGIKIFGKPKMEWQQKRLDRFVAKMRKRMRRRSPDIDRAISLFYTRP